MIAEAEALDFVEQIVTHIESHILRGFLGPVALREVKDTPYQCQTYQAQCAQDDDLHMPWRNAVVYHPADDLGDDQIGGCHQYQAGHRTNRYQPIWS